MADIVDPLLKSLVSLFRYRHFKPIALQYLMDIKDPHFAISDNCVALLQTVATVFKTLGTPHTRPKRDLLIVEVIPEVSTHLILLVSVL